MTVSEIKLYFCFEPFTKVSVLTKVDWMEL